mgnify:CR=1 FL=1
MSISGRIPNGVADGAGLGAAAGTGAGAGVEGAGAAGAVGVAVALVSIVFDLIYVFRQNCLLNRQDANFAILYCDLQRDRIVSRRHFGQLLAQVTEVALR